MSDAALLVHPILLRVVIFHLFLMEQTLSSMMLAVRGVRRVLGGAVDLSLAQLSALEGLVLRLLAVVDLVHAARVRLIYLVWARQRLAHLAVARVVGLALDCLEFTDPVLVSRMIM